MNVVKSFWTLAVRIAVVASFGLNALRATDERVFPPDAVVEGRTLGQWAAEWWRWAATLPVSRNPIRDATGEFAGAAQGAQVFFLAGSSVGATPVTRTCIVPEGVPVFFPIINIIGLSAPGEAEKCEDWRLPVRNIIDGVCELSCELDGTPIAGLGDHRHESPCFDIVVPAENHFGVPAGCTVREAVTDGFWLMLRPLPVGIHTLTFKGRTCDAVQSAQDVSYTLEVGARAYPPGARVEGKTLGEWAAEWWSWAASIPVAENPIRDKTGEHCRVAQDGPVFFLAGKPGGDPEPVMRSCAGVPEGVPIFFPITTVIVYSAPGEPEKCEDWRPLARDLIDQVAELECTLDGMPVVPRLPDRPEEKLGDHREESPCFDYCVPEDNIQGLPPGCTGKEAVTDGYWLMLAPLKRGVHTLSFKGRRGNSMQDVSYELTVGGGLFRRGDANNDGPSNVTDAVFTLDHLFRGGEASSCADAADADDDGRLLITDAIFLLNALFLGGCAPAWPGLEVCAGDPTADLLGLCDGQPCGG